MTGINLYVLSNVLQDIVLMIMMAAFLVAHRFLTLYYFTLLFCITNCYMFSNRRLQLRFISQGQKSVEKMIYIKLVKTIITF